MKQIRNVMCVLVLALLCLFTMRDGQVRQESRRIWVNGTELTGGGTLAAGGGTVTYDKSTGMLTLQDAELTGDFRGSAIYAEGSVCLRLVGHSAVNGQRSGCTVLGDLMICGSGSLQVQGQRSGAAVRGCVTVYDSAELTLVGDRPLRWGSLHVSPLDAVLEERETLRVCGPYAVLLLDGAVDAAGHPLMGSGMLPQQSSVRLGDRVPVPAEPSRAGYRFGGWYADELFTVPFDFEAEYASAVVLYARWIQIVELTYDAWGGSTVETGRFDWGEAPRPPAEPSRAGYRFAGWYGDDRLEQPFDWEQPMEAPRTAYAKWEKQADMTVQGLDAARYQGEIDWEAAADSGITFAMLRIGYRGYGAEGLLNPDANFEVNYLNAMAAGLDVGVYFFSQATTEAEAREEAAYVLELLDGRALSLPVVLDYELATTPSGGLGGRLYEAGLEGEGYAANCLAFCEAVEASGYTAAVYAGQAMLRDRVGEALEEAGYQVWLAHWTVQTRYNGAYTFWQYTDSGYVPGIEGGVDLDLRYVTIPKAVTGLKVRAEEGFHFLFWDRSPGAQGYVVYRAEPGSSDFQELTRLNGAASIQLSDYSGAPGCRYQVAAWVSYLQDARCGPPSSAVEATS